MSHLVKLLIDGQWREGRGGERSPVFNPATSEKIGEAAMAGRVELEEAVKAADKGFRAWRAVPAVERCAVLRRGAALMRERLETIAALMTREQGKPLREARIEVGVSVDLLEWFAEDGRRVNGVILPARLAGGEQRLEKEPIGPVAAFTPWNFPVSQAIRKIGPALAAGCSVVLKPPLATPLSVAAVVECLVDGGLPDGALNMVFGVPSEVSEFLVPHPVIRKVSFTGSVPIGKHLASLAGLHMKPTTMELGGHAPVILLDDVDLDRAMSVLVAAKYRNAGQVCVSPTRFLVPDRLYEDAVGEFARRAKEVVVGNGMEDSTAMGPLVSEGRVGAVGELVDSAVRKGASLRAGGERIGNAGNFFQPTVLADVTRDMEIMNDEPFGPVACFMRYDGDEAALAEANRLPFGLAAYVFGRDLSRIERMTQGIEAGMITVNHVGIGVPEAHFGGVKDSGYGSEGGAEAISAYLVSKFVTRSAHV